MMRGWAEFEEVVRGRVCGACAYRAEVCEGQPPGRCVLFELFPLVVQAILATEGRELADYQRAIRENVCAACTEAALDLSCELRDEMVCALDQYLAEVIEAVRDAAAQSEGRPRPVAGPGTDATVPVAGR